jgi:GrpB-like predicted nucleotidyltransferase (UPF0157 family)
VYIPSANLRPLSGPIRIVDYDSDWPRRFDLEANKIRSVLGSRAFSVEHVGSTAVPGLAAKPIIDVLHVVTNSAGESEYVQALERVGYQLHIREPGWHEHRMFKSSAMDVNLHVFSIGSTEVERMLAFRDWLRSNASDCELYARSKRALAQRDWKYTQNYADAKTAVIKEIPSRIREPKGPTFWLAISVSGWSANWTLESCGPRAGQLLVCPSTVQSNGFAGKNRATYH